MPFNSDLGSDTLPVSESAPQAAGCPERSGLLPAQPDPALCVAYQEPINTKGDRIVEVRGRAPMQGAESVQTGRNG